MEKEKGLANKAFFNRILAERGGLALLSATPSIHAGFRGAACKMFPAFVPRNTVLRQHSITHQKRDASQKYLAKIFERSTVSLA